jgi:hypothetical protein
LCVAGGWTHALDAADLDDRSAYNFGRGAQMMRTLVLALSIGVGGAGCMKPADDTDGGLTQVEARAAGDALGNGVEEAASTYGPMVAASADSTCITLGGDTLDPDADSIPNNATLTYNCTTQALGYTGTLAGTATVTDDQPAAHAWAFSGSADLHATLTGPGGASITSDWSGSLAGSQASPLGPYALDRVLGVVTVFAAGGGDDGQPVASTTVTEDNDWTVTFTPQATWTPGGVIVTGSLAATGAWNVTVNEKTFSATLATPTPLTVNPACATLLTAGVVTGTYPEAGGTMGSIVVTWTGCGQRTVSR